MLSGAGSVKADKQEVSDLLGPAFHIMEKTRRELKPGATFLDLLLGAMDNAKKMVQEPDKYKEEAKALLTDNNQKKLPNGNEKDNA